MVQKNELTAERQWSRRAGRRRRFLAVGLIGVAVLGWAAVQYKVFEVKSVRVEGAEEELAEAISGMTQAKYIFGGVGWGGEMPPEIEEVEVKKNYWMRTVTILVKERQEYGQWCGTDGACYWFDRSGVAFKQAPLAGGRVVKVVIGRGEVKLGEKVMAENEFDNLIKFLDAVDEAGVVVGRIVIGEEGKDEAVVYLGTEEAPVYFSLRDEPVGVKRALQALRGDLGRLEYIDLRSPNRVYYKYR